jgi:hypothetical protein
MKKSLLTNRSDFYIQTNNERDGYNACQRTALAQCFDIMGEVNKITGPYKQPEDNIDWLANDPKSPYSAGIIQFAKHSHGEDMGKPKYVGNIVEWADVLSALANSIVDYNATAYHKFTVDQIIAEIDKGLPVMVSLKFPELKIDGHYVSIVGYEDVGNERYLIIADPYKNTLLNKPDGFCVPYSPADFAAHYKGYGIRFFKRG